MKTIRQIIHLAAFAGVVVVMIIPVLILLCMEKEAHEKRDYEH
jgi:MFS-type transporter involved in bile tolerance (Atg22 family)